MVLGIQGSAMTETHAPPPDVKIHRLRFVAFSAAFLLVATIIGGSVIGFKTINRLNAIQSDWLEFRCVTQNSVALPRTRANH